MEIDGTARGSTSDNALVVQSINFGGQALAKLAVDVVRAKQSRAEHKEMRCKQTKGDNIASR